MNLPPADSAALHDHIDWLFDDGTTLRLRDPRRFGAVLWTDDAAQHPLLAHLGPEPLTPAFDAAYLHAQCQRRGAAIKQVIMDAQVVVGVGNIYASEALFRAGIRPQTPARRLSKARLAKLAAAIRAVLTEAGEFDARRNAQQVDWTWSMVRDTVLDRVFNNRGVRRVRAEVERQVRDGELTPTLAAQQILDAAENTKE